MADPWEEDYSTVGNPWDVKYEPAPAPAPKKATIAGELWQAAKDLPTHIKGSIGASLEGNQPFAENDYKDRWVQESRDLSKQRMSELPQDELQRNLLPGISVQDFRQLSPSMGFSLAGQAAGLASGLATTAATRNPFAGYAAGGIASGIVAKRSQENAFLRDLRQKADQDAGRPVTNEEFAPIATKHAQEAADYGTAEMLPEAVGNVADLLILRSPGTGFGKTLITRAFKKLASMYGTEVATEAITQQFQQRQEAIAGLTPEKKRELTNLNDWWNSLKEVAGPTILQTTLMAGAGKVGSTVYDKATGGAKTIHPTHPEITTETPVLSPEATQPSPIAAGLTPEPTPQSQDEFAAFQQSEGRDAEIQTQADQREQRNLDSIPQSREEDRGVPPDQQVAAAQAATDETQTAMAATFAKAQLGDGALGRAASAGIDSGAVDPLQIISPATPATQDRVATLLNLSDRARNVGDETMARQFAKMAMSEPGKKENLKFIDQIVTNLEKKAGVNNGTTGQQATEIPAQSSQIGGDNLSTGVGNTSPQRISSAAERGLSTTAGIAVSSSEQPESLREQVTGSNVAQGDQNVIQKPESSGILPRQQETTGEAGGGRVGVGQVNQGVEATAKSAETQTQAQVAKVPFPLSKASAERVAKQFTAQGMPTFVVPHPTVEGKYIASNTPATTAESIANKQNANTAISNATQQPNVAPVQAAEPSAAVQQVQNAVKKPWQMTVNEFDAATRAEAVKNAPHQPESWYIAQAKRNHDNAVKRAIESGEAGVTPQDSVSATSQTAPADNSPVLQASPEAKVLGTPISVIADKPLDSMAKSNSPVGEAARKEQSRRKSITPLEDIRLNDEAIRAELQRMPAESGWSEVGGRLIRIPNSEVAGDETISRTKWIPHAEWYGAGLGNREFITTAVDKALAGKPMRAAEKRTVTHMLSYLQDKMYPNLDGYDTNTLDDAGVLDDNDAELSSLDSLLSAYEEKAGVNSEYAQYLTALGNEDIGETYDTEAEIGNSQTEPVAATKPQEGGATGNAADHGKEKFALETQSAKDLAAKEARANDEAVANREIADKERGHFTLTPQTQEKTQGATQQGQILTPTGEASQQARVQMPNAEKEQTGSVKESAKQTQEAKSEEPAPIEDFGAHIPGSRKEKASALREAVSRELSDNDIAAMPLSKIWPKESVSQIEDPFIAAVANAARAEVPSKPKVGYKLKAWVEKVKTVRNLVSGMLDGTMSKERFAEALKGYRGLEHFATKVSLLEQIDRTNWDRIGTVWEYPNAYTYDADGKQISTPSVAVEIDGNRVRFNGVKSVLDVIDQVQKKLGVEVTAKKMEFEVRGREGEYFINKKGDPLYRKLATFSSSKEALSFKRDNYDKLVAGWEAVKDSDNVKETDVRGSENKPRMAEDWRKGKDVTPEQFAHDLGFKGVQFGEWVSQGKNVKERQGMLNEAYDALMDLAAIIDVPPKALSLNGSLGLGFGARGSGKFSAHFEPDMLVINLTKTRGAGSLAHEFFHAMDNYFQSMRGEYKGKDNIYITQNPENYYVNKQTGLKIPQRAFNKMIDGESDKTYGMISQRFRDRSQWELKEGVRPEVSEAFTELVKTLNESPMARRAALIDKGKTGGYWSNIVERGARAFENYVIHKMALNGYHNDYLANVVAVEQFLRNKDRYPYLLEGEIKPVAEAFDNLFSTIKTKETDQGTALYEPTLSYPTGDPGNVFWESGKQAAINAAKTEQDKLNEYDLAKEVKNLSETGNVDLSEIVKNPSYWDSENEEFTKKGLEEVDRVILETARDNLRLPDIKTLDDIDRAHQWAQYEAMKVLLDFDGIEYQDTSSRSSKYLEVRGVKLRFADHPNMTRDSAIRGQSPIINVAPGEYTFTAALQKIENSIPVAGEPNVSKTEGTNQRKLDKAANLRDMDASGALRHPESEGKFASQTQLVKENTRRIGAARVTTPEQAAQALSYLGRGAVERFDALVTDKNGKPLAIVGAFKGAISQASVYPSTLVGEAFRVPNAAAIWFAHNHPSGLAEFSQADRNIYSKLKDAFQGSRIEPKGMFAISGSEGEARNWVYAHDNAEDRKGTTASGIKGIGIPVMERVYTSTGKLWSAINSPSDAKSAIRHIAGNEPGIILLDAQHTPVAFVPWKPENTAPLRNTGNMDALYRAISVANSASAMIANPGNAYTINQINNLSGLFNSLDVKLLDVMEYGQNGDVNSMAEKGVPLDNNTFFSQSSNPVADPHTLSSLKAAINSAFRKDFAGLLEATGKFKLISRDEIVKHLGEKSLFSAVQDHTDSIREKVKNAQEKPDIRYSSDGSRILAFVSKGGIFLVYDNISQTNDSVAGILKHEIGVHARRLGRTDPEFQKILKQVEVMHKTGNKAVVDAFNRVPEDTAPENVTEESIGYLVEHAPNLSISQKIIAWVRNAIRSMGDNLKGMDKLRWVQWANRLDEKDIVYIATQATRTAPETLASANRDGMYKAWQQQGMPLFSKSQSDQSTLSEESGSIYDKIPSLPLVSKPIVGERFTLPGETQAQRFQRKSQNESNRWKVVQDAVVKQGGTVTPKTNVVDAILAYPGKVAAKYLKFGTDKIEPIMKRIAEANTTMDEVGLLAYAEHAHERNEAISEINPRFPNNGEQGKSGSGMTDKQAADIIAQAKSQPNANELFALAQELRDINDARLDMLVASGEMSQAQADAYRAKYKKYIQLKGFEEIDENGIPQGTGKGLSTGSKIDFRALGRSSMAGQIVQNVFRDYEAAVMLSEKSEVAKVVANFIEANPDSKLWTVGQPESKPMITKGQSVHQVLNNGEVVAEFKTLAAAQGYAKALNDSGNKATIESHVITAETVTQRPSMFDENAEIRYIKDGKVVRIQINDPGLVRSYNRLWHPGVSEGLKFLNTYNGWLRKMYTQKNPAWFFMNALRDIPSAVIYSTGEAGAGMTLKIPANIPAAFKAAWNFHHNKSSGPVMDNIIKMYLDNGGYTGFSYVGDIEAQTIKLDGIIHKYTSWAQTADTFKRGEYRKGLGDVLTKTMNTRMFAWIEALNTTFENMTRLAVFKSAIESGMTPQQAGLLAKHASTNFNQRGEWGPNMNAAWLFSNAGIQGTRNVGHALFFSPHKQQVWALMSGMIALGIMAGLVSDDDDDLIDDQARQRALTFKIGDSQVSLPLPWGFGFFAGFGQYIAQFLKHPEKRDKIAVMMADLTMNHFFPFGNPLSGGEAKIGNLSNITPTAIRPFANAATNTSPFGGPLYPENQFDKTQPDSEKQWRRTKGSGYDATAKWLNELTGGDVAREGAISVSPESLKLGVSTLFGGLGKLISDSASLLVSDDIQSKNVPVVKNIYRSVDADSYLQRFYKDSEDAANAYKTYRAYLKAGKINEAREYLLEEHAYVTMGKTVTLYSKYMKALRDQEEQIKLSDISDNEKSLRVKALDAKRKMIAEKFNARLKSL